jgi:hypothetical protein
VRFSPIALPAAKAKPKSASKSPLKPALKHAPILSSFVIDTSIVEDAITAADLFGEDSGDDASPYSSVVAAASDGQLCDASASIAMAPASDKVADTAAVDTPADDIAVMMSKKCLIDCLDKVNAFSLYGDDEIKAKQQIAAAYFRERGYHDKAWAGMQQVSNKGWSGRDFSFYNHASERARVLSGLSINNGGPVVFDDGIYNHKNFCSIDAYPLEPNKVSFWRYHESLPHPLGGQGITLLWGEPIEALAKSQDKSANDERMVKATAKTGKGGIMSTWIPYKEAVACGLEIAGEA